MVGCCCCGGGGGVLPVVPCCGSCTIVLICASMMSAMWLCLFLFAEDNAVSPTRVGRFGEAPRMRSSETISACPLRAANRRAQLPL